MSTAGLACACALVLASFAYAHEPKGSGVTVQTKRADDKVELKSEGGQTVVVIRSPFGISQAVIQRTESQWPHRMIVRLQLRGLEHLRLANGKTILEAATSAHDGQLSVRQWKDRAEDSPLDASSRYWIAMRLTGSDGKPSTVIPLKDGMFELNLPAAFLDDNPKSITVSWIDFYRG